MSFISSPRTCVTLPRAFRLRRCRLRRLRLRRRRRRRRRRRHRRRYLHRLLALPTVLQ